MSRADSTTSENLTEGDVVRVEQEFAEFGLVVSSSPGARVHLPRSGATVTTRALPTHRVTKFDAILGVDANGSTHLLDRSAEEVHVFERTEDFSSFELESVQNVSESSLAKYVEWIETDQDRPWKRDTLLPDLRRGLERGESA